MKEGMLWVFRIWLGIFCVQSGLAEVWRVAVTADSPGTAALVTAGLSQFPDVTVVERRQASLLVDEDVLDSLYADATKSLGLGRLLGVDRLLDVRSLGKNSWEIRLVEVSSGALLGTEKFEGRAEDLAGSASLMLRKIPLKIASGAPRVAVLDFQIPEDTDETKMKALRLAGELRLRLQDSGILVLDRTASAQIRNEHMLREKGWTDWEKSGGPLLGADFVVMGRQSRDHLELAVLQTDGGEVMASEMFAISAAENPVADEALPWILRKVKAGSVPARSVDAPSLQVEALDPFYRGIALFHQGDYLRATDEFQQAYSLHDKFIEALLWEARCYERVGLLPLARAVRVYVERNLVGTGMGTFSSAQQTEGLTFLGIAGPKVPLALRKRLEVLATEAAERLSDRVLLPASLGAFRDEYDSLLGVKDSRGVSWREAPGFLTAETLTGRLDPREKGWTLWLEINDTVSGDSLASQSVSLREAPHLWPSEISLGITTLLRDRNSINPPVADGFAVPLKNGAEEKSDLPENVKILRQALEDPAGLASAWRPLQKPSFRLPLAMNIALREYLLSRIPEDHPARPWMELEHISGFLLFDPVARPYAIRVLDPLAELENFVARQPDSVPGLVAEYMLLRETMAGIPYADLEKRFTVLSEKVSAAEGTTTIAGWENFRQMPRALAVLASIATGERTGLLLPAGDSWYGSPHRMLPRVGAAGKISLENASPWAVRAWRNMAPIAPEDAVHEARAAIVLLGRGNNRFPVDLRWLEEFPNSLALTCYVIRSLRMADRDEGLPLRNPFDAAREREEYRIRVHYVFDQLRREIRVVRNPAELDWIEKDQLREFFTELSRPGFRQTVPDDEVNFFLETLGNDVDAAAVRCNRDQRKGYDVTWLDWRKINRSVSVYSDQNRWLYDQGNIYDRRALGHRAAGLLAESARLPLLESPWYRELLTYKYASMPPKERAAFFFAGYPRLLADYAESDFGSLEMERLLQFGGVLLSGGYEVEAERLFRIVAEAPGNDVNRSRKTEDVRANARLHLAAIAIHAGREIEGADALRQILAGASDHPIKIVEDGGWRPQRFETVQGVALRLLSDLREDDTGRAETSGVRQVRIRVPGYFPGRVAFWYRVPAGFAATAANPHRVLLLAASVNQGAADYCSDDSEWARFADEQGLFLVVPQFMEFWSDSTLPQDWSGVALIAALAEIRKSYPVEAERILFHGFGFGASFLQRLALWKPEMCSAASLHSTFDWAWQEALPGDLHSLSALKTIPHFVTCGEEDGAPDHSERGSYAPTVRFVTYASGAGIPVQWKSLPGVVHRPTREMEDMARSFLADHLARERAQPAYTVTGH